MSTVERMYALTKVASGDYLFPSNDGKTLWRVSSYFEDGSAAEWREMGEHARWRPLIGTFWQTTYYTGPGTIANLPDDFLEWEHWHTLMVGLRSRSDAIVEALS